MTSLGHGWGRSGHCGHLQYIRVVSVDVGARPWQMIVDMDRWQSARTWLRCLESLTLTKIEM